MLFLKTNTKTNLFGKTRKQNPKKGGGLIINYTHKQKKLFLYLIFITLHVKISFHKTIRIYLFIIKIIMLFILAKPTSINPNLSTEFTGMNHIAVWLPPVLGSFLTFRIMFQNKGYPSVHFITHPTPR